MLGEIRHLVRALRRSPGFTAAAVLTLGLGIGATTAIFSLIDGVLLRPLAYPNPERLYVIHESFPNVARMPVNAGHFERWRAATRSFDGLALLRPMTVNLTGRGEPEPVSLARASAALFPMLGVRAQAGRLFLDEEDRAGRDRVVMLSDAFWRRRFDGDPAVIGQSIMLDGEPYDVIGILPPQFRFPKVGLLYETPTASADPQIWKPFGARDFELFPVGNFNFAAVVRLKPGVSAEQALDDLNVVQADVGRASKTNLRTALVPLHEQVTGRLRDGFILLSGAVGLLLVIACANIANLLLARAAHRQREIAIRTALGASRWRLVRQMLLESLVLTASGGVLGLGAAAAVVPLVQSLAPLDLPRIQEMGLDARAAAFAIVTMIVTSLAVVFPARRFSMNAATDVMRSGSAAVAGGSVRARARSILVGLEVAMSVMCLIAGGLLLHSFVLLLSVDRGFEAGRVLVMSVTLPVARYGNQQSRATFIASVLERIERIPGASSAGTADFLPLTGQRADNTLLVDGASDRDRPIPQLRFVDAGYFRTLSIPVRAGRLFADTDNQPGRLVAVVSESTAARAWPGRDAVGQTFRMGNFAGPVTVVGVVGDVRHMSLADAPALHVYAPYWQMTAARTARSFIVKTAGEPTEIYAAMGSALRAIDPSLPLPPLRAMDDIVDDSVAARRFQMNLVLTFAAIALVLTALGVYGVVAYDVTQRTSEFGVRMALGARRGGILRLVLLHGLGPAGIGLVVGMAAAVAIGQFMRSLLFSITATDPITLAAVSAFVMLVAVLASVVPAYRATRVNPIVALRYE